MCGYIKLRVRSILFGPCTRRPMGGFLKVKFGLFLQSLTIHVPVPPPKTETETVAGNIYYYI